MSTTQTPSKPVPLPLPETLNPDALDVLSELANLLTRLRALPTTTTTTGSAGPTTAAATPSQPPPQTQNLPGTTPTPSSSSAILRGGSSKPGGELSLKEIPAATDALKHRFRRARAVIGASLPDLDRGVHEQEVEIRALEARIARQRDALERLREVGARFVVGQGDGDGDGDKMEE